MTYVAFPRGYIAAPGSGCTVTPATDDQAREVDQIDCTDTAAITRVIARVGDGRDFVQAEGVAIRAELDGGAGDDDVRSGSAQVTRATLLGGPGSDEMGSRTADVIMDGGPGVDLMFSGPGDDHFTGGSGFDLVSYDDRDVPITASIGDTTVDGDPASGELDIIDGDIEGLGGGSGADILTGDGRTNVIEGGSGNDRIEGGGEADILEGGPGSDVLEARDGVPDRVGCGPDADTATVDDFDSPGSCELVSSSPQLQPDRDGDGVLAPGDCNDLDAGIAPGAFDVPENGVDENCDRADTIVRDRDRDGLEPPLDCDDANAAIRPGTEEIPGNLVDEDCSGGSAPFPKVSAAVLLAVQLFPPKTRLVSLTVADLEGGERIDVACRGRGCPFASTSARAAADAESFVLRKQLRKRKLAKGARLTVTVTRLDGVAKVVVLTMRSGKAPSRKQQCVAPPGVKAELC